MKRIIKVRNISKKIGKKKILDKIMTGLYSMDEGEVYYYDINLKNDFEKAMSMVGTLIESPDMYKSLSGKKNLEIFKKMFKGVDQSTIEEIVNIVEMEKYLGRKFKTYSLGMKERLAIASSLINKPKILILDEPTNGLDPVGIRNIMNTLKELKNTTIIISSHMLSEIEGLCTKVIFINDGKINNIKIKEKNDKRNVTFEVDDFSRAKLLINNYCIGDNIEVYESDEKISEINKELVLNNIKVYRIHETENTIEKDFFNMVGKHD